ncbi:nucleotide sugar dehydrogenase [Streptomyces sp. A012304]|uniref:nucleotide sugar dehydrogenase n=1 Tax=Streptomyces sp. A012304 TaxID=375446 RepID=UPI00222F7540|nr:nucleotide sugar dehydrogenase [Streptomyces sp. A012304]GKQ36649.1 UDP-N-acetyl-D-mannosaminuronic acid dehydrogenase [Streptomyces sp. A012304]
MGGPSDDEIAIWGLGLIGYTLAGELARTGRRCLIMDIDEERVARLNSGEMPFTHLPKLPYTYAAETRSGMLRATTEDELLLTADHPVHILCIPTEAQGSIDDGTLGHVVKRIANGARARPLHVVVESTIAPAWIDSVIHPAFQEAGLEHRTDYHLGSSPRRDWLTERGRTMASIPKIIGGDSPEITALMRKLYEPICGEIHEAPDAKHAALVKVIENYFRYRDILLANELVTMLPGYDVSSVLRMASTKWNMQEYHPSLGIGGYCVPLAKDYLAAEPGLEGLAEELDSTEERLFSEARRALRKHGRFGTVAVLGVAYAPEMKIHARSPGVRLARELAKDGVTVRVHDPLYSDDEITRITGCAPLRFPDGLAECDSVVLVTPHEPYRAIDREALLAGLSQATCVVDNLGTWAGRAFPEHVRYVEVGGPGYISGPVTLS